MRPRPRSLLRPLAAAALCALLAGCAREPAAPPSPPAPPEPRLELAPVPFERLSGWHADDPRAALDAFRISCTRLSRQDDGTPMGPDPAYGVVGDWRPACDAAELSTYTGSAEHARAFFEDWFFPHLVSDGGDPEGLFTGYYEPQLFGSLRYGGRYTVPLHLAPGDLLRIDLGRFNPELAGYSIAGRIEGNQFVPYYSRGEIENGALGGRGLELLWVDDRVDKFFLQIQGSGQVVLEDGRLIRVGYAAQNGHPYRAIGRDLIEIGALSPEGVSMQSIRAWLEANPGAAQAIMDRNRSYVFFQENSDLGPDDGPIGAQGVPLTAGRSLAVDLRFIPLGTPVWLDSTAPFPDGEAPLRQLMIAQDTGGAIKGVVRGDVFWGAGPLAEAVAGRMKSTGRYAVLLPRSMIPTG
jgi:membrane-bound lytic murein transglycosylase A